MPGERLVGQAQTANARIYELSQSDAEHAGMGTTLTALYVGDETSRSPTSATAAPTACATASSSA